MTQYRCPNCDGPFELAPHSSTVVCPYCSTTIQVKTGEVIKESYVMRVQFNLTQVHEKLFSWASKQLGVPKDIEDKAEIKEKSLVYYPFWVVEVEAKADYSGVQKKPYFDAGSKITWTDVVESGHIEIEQDVFIPAARGIPSQLERYIIPTRRKEFFSKEIVKNLGGELLGIQVDKDAAVESSKDKMKARILEEVLNEVDKVTAVREDINVPAVFLVHIPIWHIKYRYSVRTYDALVDAASGRVISLKFPRQIAFRAMTLFGGLIHLGVGGGIGLLLVYIGYLWGNPIFPTVFGIVFGLGMLGFSVRFFLKAISLRAEEEMAG
ncbi:MAG: hypothetical protein EAX95_08440 [Candidatus Thorarchaeota archaeon]|nr:hypothetical protein [Candidatus Thorarchaeota archaeon]